MATVPAKKVKLLVSPESERRKKIFDILYPIIIGFVFWIVTKK